MKKLFLLTTTKKTFFASILLASSIFTSCQLSKPFAVTANPIGSKRGQAASVGILVFPPFAGEDNNCSIERAAKNGGITKISTVDYSFQWYLLFTKRVCTVTGE